MSFEIASVFDAPDYWRAFYNRSGAPDEPSDFACNVAARWPELSTVIDVGCGNGRDSAYFAALGRSLYGLDACGEAIANCERRVACLDLPPAQLVRFVASAADDPATWAEIANVTGGPTLIYARFLFHAVTDDVEARILAQASAVLKRCGALAAEFRTPRDQALAKAMPAHFRRFVDPEEFCARIEALGLTVVERCEGQGLAIYQDEDAYVARVHAVA